MAKIELMCLATALSLTTAQPTAIAMAAFIEVPVSVLCGAGPALDSAPEVNWSAFRG